MSVRWPTGLWAAAVLLAGTMVRAERIEIVWPTPNPAWLRGEEIEAFVQPTVSGEATSGLYGCVRSSGAQFHEGLDLLPVKRDKRGEALDPIFAVLPGVVRHINKKAGASSYGRYIVIEHTETKPAIYTLYAHLKEAASDLRVGDSVRIGQTVGTMGRSAGGYTIPKERAHLHLEMGVRLTDDFQPWYKWKKFGSPNEHGVWNGMNLLGFDPLDFYTRFRAKEVNDIASYIAKMEAVAVVRVARSGRPDFVQRYPELIAPGAGWAVLPAGWEVKIGRTGIPFSWRPLAAEELEGYRRNEVRVVSVDETLRATCRCRDIVVKRRGAWVPAKDLETVLQLVFGLRN